MKAIIHTQYGSLDELQMQDIQLPAPGNNDLLVRVHAASVTSSDCNVRNLTFVPRPFDFLSKLQFGLKEPKIKILGIDFSGTVEKVGKNVTNFKVGDDVFGSSEQQMGAYAEYLCIPADKAIFKKPDSIPHEQAAALPIAGSTALYFLKELADIKPGQSILVNGASGAVGSYAVQIAKYFGLNVTGVCSTNNLELVTSLGTDTVIDYTTDDFTHNENAYDVIFDAVSRRSFSECRRALKEDGIYLDTLPRIHTILQMLSTSIIGGKKVKMGSSEVRQSDLVVLSELAEAHALFPVIGKTFALEQIADAFRYAESGHKVGNIVITIG